MSLLNLHNKRRLTGVRFSETDNHVEGVVEAIDAPEPESVEPPVLGEEALSDAGKKALLAMRAQLKAQKTETAQAKAECDRLQAQTDGSQADFEARPQAERLQAEALDEANDRIRRAETRAAAVVKSADLTEPLQLSSLFALEVEEERNTDAKAITSLIDDLIQKKHYLPAQGGPFEGSAHGCAHKEPAECNATLLSLMWTGTGSRADNW